MAAPKRFLFILFFTISLYGFGQECNNCDSYPKLIAFGFDVQVPEPGKEDSTENLWPQWKALFRLADHVSSKIKAANQNCVGVVLPPPVDTGDVQMMSVGGETFVNLPSNPNIASDLSVYGNYLMTGNIQKSGEGYLMHIEIQTSCSRKIVAAVDVPFQLSTLAGNVNSVAQQAVAQISPLHEKIRKFEIEERQRDKSLSLLSVNFEPIKITAVKPTLKPGESTEFTIELKDCDGKPIANREILFSQSSFGGLKIHGTLGGSVSPLKLITDANGVAKGRFTLKAGAKEAIINAHSPGKDVRGCNSIFVGDAAINIKRTYSGYVRYSLDNIDQCEKQTQSGVTNNHTSWNHVLKVQYSASFYSEGAGFSSADNSSDDLVPDVLESGSMMIKNYQIARSKVANNAPTMQVVTKDQSGGVRSATLSFSSSDKLIAASLDMKFDLQGMAGFKQTYLEPSRQHANEEYVHSFTIYPNDPNVKYQKIKSGNTVKHIITYLRTQTLECTQRVERFQLYITEE